MKKSNSQKIIVILGPTSSGKSDLAIEIAQKYDGEIISADSRQIYRGMNVGTGKIEPDRPGEIPDKIFCSKIFPGSPKNKLFLSNGIPHHMIDIISPKTDYNVSKYKKRVQKIIKDILKRKKLPIICGGTGFWIKALVDNVNFPKVKPNWKLREKLNEYSAEKLFLMLKKLDPERAGNIDAKNKVRLIRAIEICKTLGKVPVAISSSPLGRGVRSEGRNFLQIGIFISRKKLNERIKIRLAKRFQQGMIKEVKKLYEQGLSWKKIESFGLGYFWIPKYLKRELTKEEVFEKIYQAEKDYAKRQMTWFQKDKRIKWIKNQKGAETLIGKFIK
jgi:tRNA dimethylallyltransferase